MTLAMKYEEKYEEGREEGRQEIRVETAKKMIAIGMDHMLIAEITGLPLEEVEGSAQSA